MKSKRDEIVECEEFRESCQLARALIMGLLLGSGLMLLGVAVGYYL